MRKVSLLCATFLVLAALTLTACGGAIHGTSFPSLAAATSISESPVVPSPTASATSGPTPMPAPAVASPSVTSTLPAREIILDSPQPGATISSPAHVSGSVTASPFESTLACRIYDANGELVGAGPVMVAAEMGQPGPFSGEVAYQAAIGGPGRIEVAELSPKDGSVVVSTEVHVVLIASPESGAIQIPAPGAQVVLPMDILARAGQPDEPVIATLRWQDGTELEQTFTTLSGEDGRGLLIDTLNWQNEGPRPQPPTQQATLELRDAGGQALASQAITVLSLDDPNAQVISLYFVLGEAVQPLQRRIPTTTAIGTAALEELLWGPPPPNLAGFTTAIPKPEEVLRYPGRGPGWGPRVTLLGLTIVDGVATANFSRQMQAHGGGSLRVMLIRQQIEETLEQFSTVREVVIAVEGEVEQALQP